MSRRGFANPEYLIVLVILIVIVAVVVPPFMRARQRSRDRALISAVNAVAQAEHAYFAASHRYTDSLTVPLPPGAQVDIRANNDGWSVMVADSGGRHRCALFEGGDYLRPDGHVGQPGEMACW